MPNRLKFVNLSLKVRKRVNIPIQKIKESAKIYKRKGRRIEQK